MCSALSTKNIHIILGKQFIVIGKGGDQVQLKYLFDLYKFSVSIIGKDQIRRTSISWMYNIFNITFRLYLVHIICNVLVWCFKIGMCCILQRQNLMCSIMTMQLNILNEFFVKHIIIFFIKRTYSTKTLNIIQLIEPKLSQIFAR